MSKFNEKAYEVNEDVTVVEVETEEVETKKGFLSKVGGTIKKYGKPVAVAAAAGVVGILIGRGMGKKSNEGYEPDLDDYAGEVEEPVTDEE